MTDYYEINGALPHAIWHQMPGDSHWDSLEDIRTSSIEDTFPTITLQCKCREVAPDYFKSGRKPIVSPKFRDLAERFSVAAEFLPVNLVDHHGAPIRSGPYWFMHMLEDIDCIDIGRSDIEALSDQPNSILRRVRRLSFLPDVIGCRAIFRPKRYLQMFVNDVFRQALIQSKCRLLLTPLSEVRLG